MQEFSEFLQPHLLCRIPLIVTGDFNVHVDVNDHFRCNISPRIL